MANKKQIQRILPLSYTIHYETLHLTFCRTYFVFPILDLLFLGGGAVFLQTFLIDQTFHIYTDLKKYSKPLFRKFLAIIDYITLDC